MTLADDAISSLAIGPRPVPAHVSGELLGAERRPAHLTTKVCWPASFLNRTTSPLRLAWAPTGCPWDQTTLPSRAIVCACGSSGTSTTPEVPGGPTTVSLNEPPRRRQREARGPCGVGASPCAKRRSPGCGATVQCRYPGAVGRMPRTYAESAGTGPPAQPCANEVSFCLGTPSRCMLSHTVPGPLASICPHVRRIRFRAPFVSPTERRASNSVEEMKGEVYLLMYGSSSNSPVATPNGPNNRESMKRSACPDWLGLVTPPRMASTWASWLWLRRGS